MRKILITISVMLFCILAYSQNKTSDIEISETKNASIDNSESYIWTRGLFNNRYQIFSDSEEVGFIKDKVFTHSAYGEISDKHFAFHITGFFKKEAIIIDETSKKEIGRIIFSSWRKKALISLHSGQEYIWKYNNIWENRWSIYKDSESIADFKGNTFKGEIETSVQNKMLILAGLFVKHYFKEISEEVFVTMY